MRPIGTHPVLLLATLVLVSLVPSAQAAELQAHAADRDCSDFSNQRDAQQYYESIGGPGSDPDRLDADDDGQACDSLPCPCGSGSPKPKPKPRPVRIPARITSVTDGDTLRARSLVSGQRYKVRMIGIDTPETKKPGTPVECGGKDAGDNLRELSFSRTGRGARVTLTTDPTQDKHDRYGRLLAYVTRRDGKNLAEAQIRAGWAKVYVFDRPFKLVDRFRAAARASKRADRGVWGRCGGDFHTPA